MGRMALRQKIRLTTLFLIVLTFPLTINYFSVYLIVEGSSQGIMTFSFFFWAAFVVSSLFVGRAACGYICPLGAYQETKDRMVPKKLTNIKFLRAVKYPLAVLWVGAIVFAAISAGGYHKVNLLYNTESGISIDRAQGWITYWMIVGIILLPAFFIGKRGFCHYFCPWGVLNITGTRIKNFLHFPSLRLRAAEYKCKNCRTCNANCPMSLDVNVAVHRGSMNSAECILCGTCADNCPNGVIRYSWQR